MKPTIGVPIHVKFFIYVAVLGFTAFVSIFFPANAMPVFFAIETIETIIFIAKLIRK